MSAEEIVTDRRRETIQRIFYKVVVILSIMFGLIDPDDLTISGDGTVVPSHASPYGHLQRPLRSFQIELPRIHYHKRSLWLAQPRLRRGFFFFVKMTCLPERYTDIHTSKRTRSYQSSGYTQETVPACSSLWAFAQGLFPGLKDLLTSIGSG